MTRQLCHMKKNLTYAKTVLKLHCFIWVMCLGLSISLISAFSLQENENFAGSRFYEKIHKIWMGKYVSVFSFCFVLCKYKDDILFLNLFLHFYFICIFFILIHKMVWKWTYMEGKTRAGVMKLCFRIKRCASCLQWGF